MDGGPTLGRPAPPGKTPLISTGEDVGVGYWVSAMLDRPLGTREVVDGACLRPEHARYSDCATGSLSP